MFRIYRKYGFWATGALVCLLAILVWISRVSNKAEACVSASSSDGSLGYSHESRTIKMPRQALPRVSDPKLLDFTDSFDENVKLIDGSVPVGKRESYYRGAIKLADSEELDYVFAWYNTLNPGRKRFRLIDAVVVRAVTLGKIQELDAWINAFDFPEEFSYASDSLISVLCNKLNVAAEIAASSSGCSQYMKSRAIESFLHNDPRLESSEFQRLWGQSGCSHRDILLTLAQGTAIGYGGDIGQIWLHAKDLPPLERKEIAEIIMRTGLPAESFASEEEIQIWNELARTNSVRNGRQY